MALGRRILVIGHRGTQPYFENTIESFKAAEKEHADAVETDVRQTKDGHCVLFHDKKLNRIFRWNVKLRKLSFKAAKKLRIPSVPELLTNIKIPINFEIKERSAVRHILPLIKKYGREKDVIISSFDILTLIAVRRVDKSIKIAYLIGGSSLISLAKVIMMLPLLKFLRVYAINPDVHSLSKPLIKVAHMAGFKVFTWTINTRKELEKAIKIGVDGVFTDDVHKIKVYLTQK